MHEGTNQAVYLVDAYSDPVAVRLEGRACQANSSCLQDFLTQMLAQGKTRFVIDFERCTSVDSTFLGVVAGVALELRRKDPRGSLVLCRLGRRNLEVVQNLGLQRILTIDAGDPPAASGDGSTPLACAPAASDVENARRVLAAHENLVAADASNQGRFQDVLEFLGSAWSRGPAPRLQARIRSVGRLRAGPRGCPFEDAAMLFFLMGGALGALVVFWLGARVRARADALEERNLRLQLQRQLVIDFMHAMVQALGEGLTREQLFQRIVHAAILSTEALSACIFEKRPDNRMQGVAVEGLFPPHRPVPPQATTKLTSRARFIERVLRSEVFDISEGIVGQVARTGAGVLIGNAAEDPRILKHDDPALAVKSIIAAPIRFQGRTIGVLAVANPVDGRPFTDSDFSLVLSLAEQAGLAVHNLESMHFQIERQQLDIDLALARSIQQMLLPASTPRLPGLDVAADYVPMQKVGGDLYDFYDLGPDRLGLAVADVSGKGIAGSLLMAICRTNLRQIARRRESPADVLRELNRALAGEVCRGMFITLVFAVVDLAKGTLTFARAGHELPLICRRDPATGEAAGEFAASEGMPVGMVDEAMFDAAIADRTVPFGPGDALVLYTDGLTEAANDEDHEFSGARLADAARALLGRSAAEINAGILDVVRRFTGKDRHRDDLTLVTVKRT